MPTISTIGYQGTDLQTFIASLKIAGVEQLIDIRDVPLSRKPGFSKKALSLALTASGLAYLHCKELGDPKAGREAMRAGRHDEFRAIFAAHLERPEAKHALREAIQLAVTAPSVLLCFEADHRCCHRHLVAEQMARSGKLNIRHLEVSCTFMQRERVRDDGHHAIRQFTGRRTGESAASGK